MIPTAELKIDYDQEKKDIIAFGFFQHKKDQYGPVFGSNWAIVILLAMAAYLVYQYVWKTQEPQWGVLVALLSFALYILSYRIPFLYGILYWPQLKRGKYAMRGPVTVVLNNEHITVQHSSGVRHFNWQSFDACVALKGYLFLYSQSGDGLLLPKRAFLLEQEAYDFASFIRQNLEENNK